MLLLNEVSLDEPPTMISDNANETIQGKFNKNLKEASCNLIQTEPFIPWSHTAVKEIKELKKLLKKNVHIKGTQGTLG